MIITYSLLVFLPALSGISGNSEQKTILHTTKQLIQYMVLGIQFRSLKYTAVIRIRKNLSNFPFIPNDTRRDHCVDVNNPLQTVFNTSNYIYLVKLYDRSIIIFLTNVSANICSEISKIRLIL